jgi:hypothetical protein
LGTEDCKFESCHLDVFIFSERVVEWFIAVALKVINR